MPRLDKFTRLVCRECGGVGCEGCDGGWQWWEEEDEEDSGEVVFYFTRKETDGVQPS